MAADSRVTITAVAPAGMFNLPPGPGGQPSMVLLPATYDSATKLLSFGNRAVGAITFGAGSIGTSPRDQRTAASFLTEFQQSIEQEDPGHQLSVEGFATRLGRFFLDRWNDAGMPPNMPPGNDMTFFVGGINADEPVGRLYELSVPSRPAPEEKHAGDLGAIWGGQREVVDRIIQGFDPRVLDFVLGQLNQQLSQADKEALYVVMRNNFSQPIPWWLLPLRDCVHVAHFLVKATISLQGWSLGIRVVGGEVDIATITRTGGFEHIKVKEITAEPAS